MRPSTLIDAFRKSGIYPVCRDQITDDQVRSSLVYSCNDQSTPLSQASESFLTEQSVFVDTTRTPLLTSTVSVLSSSGQSTPLSQACETSLPEQNVLVSATGNVSRQSGHLKQSAYSDAFDALESVIETPVKTKYRRRLDEGYNLDGSPTFQTWKKLRTAASINQLPNESRTQQQTCSTSAPWPYATSASSLYVSPVLEEITIYPSAPENTNARRSNVKRSLPNFLNGETSMKILLDAKLKKSRELAARQKKLREREEKKEAKRREQEAKKREIQERKKKGSQKTAEKKRNAGARNKRTTNGREWRQSLPQSNDNSCKVCWQEYSPSDDETLPWVMCDQCELWMHIECIPIGVDQTPIDNDEQFFCHDCC